MFTALKAIFNKGESSIEGGRWLPCRAQRGLDVPEWCTQNGYQGRTPPPLRKLNEFKIEQKNYFDGVLGTIETILDIVLTLFWPA